MKIIFVSSLFIFSMKSFGAPETGCLESDLSIIQKYQQGNDAEFQGDVKSIQCKKHPQNENQVFASYIKSKSTTEDYQSYLWRVLLIDNSLWRVTSSYNDVIVEGGDTEIKSTSINLDTARYYLDENTRALGVRLNIGTAPRCANFLANDFLNLFVQDGEKLKPVLKNMPTYFWYLAEGDHCSDYEGVIKERTVKTVLHLLKSNSNGFRDIRISNKIEEMTHYKYNDEKFETKRVNKVIKFNGDQYFIPQGTFSFFDGNYENIGGSKDKK
ncbi:hypothetical protein L4174_020435 [Photobacterium sp. CCB-ST2H9]|uniref:hypothetical protein n=1 Tax=Photobacterium sp. CCB-ST2H9 TaxID=2912855 RepID=UPI002003E504|nr:hypothetical protein [Photobacterium sp. CCB-ST2H9]UTM59083.1 hypothetical protein L4174_020435 [Photobacterium sp. CCB-ST2H9]